MALQPGTFAHATSDTLPTLLCLHGGGTNATIFNIQLIRIQRILSSTFNFVFLDGPFDSPPGPGVLPTLAGCEPFQRWVRPGDAETPEETKTLIRRVIEERREKGGFAGVVGFSQGAKIAAGLLLEEQVRARKLGKDGSLAFKFGVLFMANSPMVVSGELSPDEKQERITIPSFHVAGTQDSLLESSRDLWITHFDHETSRFTEVDVGHRLPTVEKDTEMIAQEIRRLYRTTSS